MEYLHTEKSLRKRGEALCLCGHKLVSHGSRDQQRQFTATGRGMCGIDRDTRNVLTGYMGDPCPCLMFDEPVA